MSDMSAMVISAVVDSPATANVPTFDESGFKNLEVDNWFGIVAPAGTPKEIVTELETKRA